MFVLLVTFVGCSKKENESDSTTSGTEVTESSSDAIEYDEKGYQKDKLGKMDFGGRTIHVLAGDHNLAKEYDVSAEEMNESVMNQAVYIRDTKVKARMNVKIDYNVVDDGSDSMTVFLKEAEALENSGEGVDYYANYSRTATSLMMRGYTKDLKTLSHLDLNAPWWTNSVREKCTVYDRLYFVSGDISPSLFKQTFIIYFNKDMAEQYVGDALKGYGVESLYELVDTGKWTLDKMMSMSKNVGSSADDNKDASDKFGFSTHLINTDAFYQASGLNVIDYNNDGSIKISSDYSSAKTQTLLETLVTFFDSPDALVSEESNDYIQAWKNDNVLFHLHTIDYAPIFASQDIKFGILPMPKYDEAQEQYHDIPGFVYTMWSVSRNTKNSDAVGAVLECMASESYREVTPALYDVLLRSRSSHSVEDYDMWETIRKSVAIEGGRCFDQQFENKTWSLFRSCIATSSSDWMSKYENYDEMLRQNAGALNRIIQSLETAYGN